LSHTYFTHKKILFSLKKEDPGWIWLKYIIYVLYNVCIYVDIHIYIILYVMSMYENSIIISMYENSVRKPSKIF
jgi:hypothetical protein